MKFSELLTQGIEEDIQKDGYTRYMIRYFDKFKKPMLVGVSTVDHITEMTVYDTNFPEVKKEQLEDFKNALLTTHFAYNSYDFAVEPVAYLRSAVSDKKAVIQNVSVSTDYERKGLGSFLVDAIQDYYAKTNHVSTVGGVKYIMAAPSIINEETSYKNKLERKTGKFGELLSHARSKVMGKQNSKVSENFLLKNNFTLSGNQLGGAIKPILSDREIISDELLKEGFEKAQRPQVIDVMGEIVNLDNCNYGFRKNGMSGEEIEYFTGLKAEDIELYDED